MFNLLSIYFQGTRKKLRTKASMHSRSYAPASLMGDLPDYQDLGDSYSATYPVSSTCRFSHDWEQVRV